MSLLNYSFWEVFLSSFSPEIWRDILPSVKDTLYMAALSSLIMLIGGIALGIVLTALSPDGLVPLRIPYTVSGWFINVLRSLPEMIMIILMIPVARLIFGQSYGTNSCIIAISASCIPMYARIVESSLLEISKGKIDAAKSIGSTNLQIIFRIIIPETLPSLIRGFTTAVITVISMTALAGNFGAGGIGDIAVRYGYQRFRPEVMIATVIILIVLVQAVQFVGNTIAKRLDKK